MKIPRKYVTTMKNTKVSRARLHWLEMGKTLNSKGKGHRYFFITDKIKGEVNQT